jgi:hypothetical protein
LAPQAPSDDGEKSLAFDLPVEPVGGHPIGGGAGARSFVE